MGICALKLNASLGRTVPLTISEKKRPQGSGTRGCSFGGNPSRWGVWRRCVEAIQPTVS